jgi:hypothetical protein
VPKNDFLRNIWSSFDLSKFSNLKSIEFFNNHNPRTVTLPNDFKITQTNSTLQKLKVVDPGAIYNLDNILKVCGAQNLKDIKINFEQLLINEEDMFIG